MSIVLTRRLRFRTALEQGPCVSKVLFARMGVDYQAAASWLTYEVRTGSIIKIGTFAQAIAAGEDEIVREANALGNFTKTTAPVYALPGTEKLPEVDGIETMLNAERALPRKKPKGNVAGPITIHGYRWAGVGQWRGKGAE